jgi:hypothetical protein
VLVTRADELLRGRAQTSSGSKTSGRQVGGGGGAPVKHAEKKVKKKRKCCNVALPCFSLFLLPFLPKILKNLKNSKYKSFSKGEDIKLSYFYLFQILLRF